MLGEQNGLGDVHEILAKHRLSVLETMTTPTRPGKKPRSVWDVKGDVYGLENFLREKGLRKFRGAWSAFADPSASLAKHLETTGREAFADQVAGALERKAERQERFERYVENACVRSDNAYSSMDSIRQFILPGQPILVGHHSEGRHRLDLKRMDGLMRKSVEESKKADYFRAKADSLGHDQNRLTNRRYLSNQIDKALKDVKIIRRYFDNPKNDPAVVNERLARANEKLTFWQTKLWELEQAKADAGMFVPSAKTIKVGDEVFYGRWLPVLRVNRKTVTVSNWLGVSSMTYKLEFSRIEQVRAKEAITLKEDQEG